MSGPGKHKRSPGGSLPVVSFWRWFTLRHAAGEWGQTLLLLLILGLGVGTFLSIRMANRAAVEGFSLFTESLSGTSDLIVESTDGGLAPEQLERIRTALGNLPARLFPVAEYSLSPLPGPDSDKQPSPVRLLGLDLVQIRSVTDEAEGQAGAIDRDLFWELIDDPNHLLISRAVASDWGVTAGDTIRLVLEGTVRTFHIQALLPEFQGNTPLPRNLAVMDLSALLKQVSVGRIDRVEVFIPQGGMRDLHLTEADKRLRKGLDETMRISSASGERLAGQSMTAAFRLNLTVLSLIALLVALYLIAQTLDATVSRRRGEIATLRSLGVTGGGIYRLWLSEAVLYGIAAGTMGLLVGTALSSLTVEAVTTTVRTLYRDTVRTASGVEGSDILIAYLLGIFGSLIAAWLPAKDAASTPPAQFLRLGKRIPPFPVFQHPWIGLAALITGGVLIPLPPWNAGAGVTIPVAGYLTAFLWLLGGTLVAANTLPLSGRVLHFLGRDRATLRLAGSRMMQPTSRHQLALSGFFVAIGMAAAMAFLIRSFEHTVTGWLEHRLRADVFVSSVGFQGSTSDQVMPGSLLDEIAALPAIAAMDRFRGIPARIAGLDATLGGIRFDLLGDRQELLWIGEPLPPAVKPPQADFIVYANENLLRRTGLAVGELIEIQTPVGLQRAWIGGMHADYSSDNGLLLADLAVLERLYSINSYSTASLFLEPGADPANLQANLQARYPGLKFRLNGELKEAALFVFEQTFAVTRALQAIGLIVALTGLALGLLSLLRESGRELSLQRTLGMSRSEIAASTAYEGMGIALTGLLSGLILSIALGYVLIYVINRQSFGWTLQTQYPFSDIALLALGVVALGFGVSYLTGALFLRKWKQQPL